MKQIYWTLQFSYNFTSLSAAFFLGRNRLQAPRSESGVNGGWTTKCNKWLLKAVVAAAASAWLQASPISTTCGGEIVLIISRCVQYTRPSQVGFAECSLTRNQRRTTHLKGFSFGFRLLSLIIAIWNKPQILFHLRHPNPSNSFTEGNPAAGFHLPWTPKASTNTLVTHTHTHTHIPIIVNDSQNPCLWRFEFWAQ